MAVSLACAVLAVVPPRACAQVDPNDPDVARTRYEAAATQRHAPDVLGWPQATARERAGLGLLSVIDQYQADLSRLALDRGLATDVQAWAERMLAADAAARGRHDRWLPDIASVPAQEEIRRGQLELAALQDADAAEVASRYLQAMHRSLAGTLQRLDEELIPAASTPGVRMHLRDLRDPLVAELVAVCRLQDRGAQCAPP